MAKYEKMKEYAFLKGSQSKILEQMQSNKNINFIDFVDEKNNTPLHYATSLNYLQAVKQYVKLLKNTQLWKEKLNQQLTDQVIRYKTKVWLNAENNDGLTALHYASLKGFTKIADCLADAGARVDKVTNQGFNIFHLAAQQGKLNSLLHFRGKLDLGLSDNNGSTPLHWAAYKGHQKIVKYLISQEQVQLNFKDKQGRTPMHIAILYEHHKIVEILLLAGASRCIKDKDNKTAIDLAEQKDDQKLLRLLKLKQRCTYKPQYVYSKKTKQNCKWIIIIFVLLFGLVISNFFVGKTPLIYNDTHFDIDNLFDQTNQKLAYSLIYFGIQILIGVISLILSLCIHCQKNTIKRYSLSYLQQYMALSDQYCFQCQVIKQEGTKHCHFCSQCHTNQIKHSHVLGRCIAKQNRILYILFLFCIMLLLLSQIYGGLFMLNYLINQRDHQIHLIILKYILTVLNLICIVPFGIVLHFTYKTVKIINRKGKLKIIKNLSQSTFDSRSTLLAQKIKTHNKKLNSLISNGNSNNNSNRMVDEDLSGPQMNR